MEQLRQFTQDSTRAGARRREQGEMGEQEPDEREVPHHENEDDDGLSRPDEVAVWSKRARQLHSL